MQKVKEKYIKLGYNVKNVQPIDKPREEYEEEQRKLGYKLVRIHPKLPNRYQRIKITSEDDKESDDSPPEEVKEVKNEPTLYPSAGCKKHINENEHFSKYGK